MAESTFTHYVHVPHPRIAERKKEHPVKVDDGRVGINGKVGVIITTIVGTMWIAYLFTIIALIALPQAIHQGTYYIIVWLSSSFLQLVLLPIIIVGQNVQAKAADKRADQTYKDAEAILHECLELQQHLAAQDQVLDNVIAKMKSVH